MAAPRDSRLAVAACTVLCVAVGLTVEWGVRAHPSAVLAEEPRFVTAAPAAPSSPPPRDGTAEPVKNAPSHPSSPSSPTSSGSTTGGDDGGTGATGGSGAGGNSGGSTAGQSGGGTGGGSSGGGTGTKPGGPTGPHGCGSPHGARGFQAAFVYPCDNSVVPVYPWPIIHVPEYPTASDGALAFVQTVLTDTKGAIKERPTFALLDGGISAATNLGPRADMWTHDVMVGRPCVHDRGRTTLSVYLLTPAGEREAEGTWKSGQPIARMPAGSALLDQVTVNRRDNAPCVSGPTPSDPPTSTTPPAGPPTTTPPPVTTSPPDDPPTTPPSTPPTTTVPPTTPPTTPGTPPPTTSVRPPTTPPPSSSPSAARADAPRPGAVPAGPR